MNSLGQKTRAPIYLVLTLGVVVTTSLFLGIVWHKVALSINWVPLLVTLGVVLIVGIPSYEAAAYFSEKGWKWIAYGMSGIAYVLGLAGLIVVVLLSHKAMVGIIDSAFNDLGAPHWTQEEKLNAVHFVRADRAGQEAIRIVNGPPFSVFSEKEVAEILSLSRSALMEGRLVRDSVLEKAYPGLSTPFREWFMRSMELLVRAFSEGDRSASIRSIALYNQWVDWVNVHKDEIKIPKP